MKKNREVIGIQATLYREDLLGLMRDVKKLRDEYVINIREFEHEEWTTKSEPYSLHYKSDPRTYKYDENCRSSVMALYAVYDTEILCGRKIDFFDVYDAVVNYKQLKLYGLVVSDARRTLSNEEHRHALNAQLNYCEGEDLFTKQLEYLDFLSRYKLLEFYKLDETAEYTRSIYDYNSMLRIRAWAFTYIRNLTDQKLTANLIRTIYSSTLIETLYRFDSYRTRSGKEYNYIKKVIPPQYIENQLNKAIDEYNKGKEKTSNHQLILDSENPDGILNFIIAIAKLFLDIQKISPFYEGEYSYTAVLVLNLELLKAGYPVISLNADDIFNNYNRIEEYNTRNNPIPMAYFIATYLEDALLNELAE